VSARPSTKCLATEPGAPTSGQMRTKPYSSSPIGVPVAGRRDGHLVSVSARVCDVQELEYISATHTLTLG
jgi:hypothetical protein